ncbi:hypothetical protein Tco_0161873, partial [Tanacetum coccineum]
MFLNMDQLEKQLDKDEFQEIGSMASFRVLETQCQKFIKSRISLDDEDGIMTPKYFLEYTELEVQQFRDTITEGKVDTSNALDASLVDTKSSRTESGEQDTSSRSGNVAHDDDADIRPLYDEEPTAEVGSYRKDTSNTTIVDSEPPHGSNTDITNLHECIQTLDSSAIIKNGNKVLKRTVRETKQEYEPTTTEDKQDRRNVMKARGTLLMALPNKDQLKFHSYEDAKLLMEAIEKRLQNLITQLEIQGEIITQEDMNLKLLR